MGRRGPIGTNNFYNFVSFLISDNLKIISSKIPVITNTYCSDNLTFSETQFEENGDTEHRIHTIRTRIYRSLENIACVEESIRVVPVESTRRRFSQLSISKTFQSKNFTKRIE